MFNELFCWYYLNILVITFFDNFSLDLQSRQFFFQKWPFLLKNLYFRPKNISRWGERGVYLSTLATHPPHTLPWIMNDWDFVNQTIPASVKILINNKLFIFRLKWSEWIVFKMADETLHGVLGKMKLNNEGNISVETA